MDKLTDVFCHFGEDVGKHVEKAPKTGAQKNKPIAYYLRCCNFKASVAKFGHDAKGLALKKTIWTNQIILFPRCWTAINSEV